MKIFVKAKTGQSQQGIEAIDQSHFMVKVKEQPEKGRANLAIIKALALHFKIPQAKIKMVAGQKSKQKVFMIEMVGGI